MGDVEGLLDSIRAPNEVFGQSMGTISRAIRHPH